LTAAAYTQPYSASVGLAHLLWSIAQRERKAALCGGTAFTLTIVAFLPWYLWAKGKWAIDMGPNSLHFSASWKTPLMLFREIAGAGYWGSALLLILCTLALARGSRAHRTQSLLALLIAAPILSVFASDALFNYFLAARQFMWVLPAVAILTATTIERHERTSLMFGTLLGIVCLWQNVRIFTTPHENWQTAAAAISDRVRRGACLVVAPSKYALLYEFFRPELRQAYCEGPQIVLAITPYTTNEGSQGAVATLIAKGYKLMGEEIAGKSAIICFRRPAL
jgi:hypothetical protein